MHKRNMVYEKKQPLLNELRKRMKKESGQQEYKVL